MDLVFEIQQVVTWYIHEVNLVLLIHNLSTGHIQFLFSTFPSFMSVRCEVSIPQL